MVAQNTVFSVLRHLSFSVQLLKCMGHCFSFYPITCMPEYNIDDIMTIRSSDLEVSVSLHTLVKHMPKEGKEGGKI